jgi:HJR/Mrr/RecB family endonuclease
MTTASYVKSGFSTQDLQDNGGRLVANLDGKKILIQDFMGDVYACRTSART